jgi:hypothetical protein
MKASIFIATCCAEIALSCASARAQDTNRVQANLDASSVVASIQTDVAERRKQAQPYQKPSRLPTNYSRWAFQSVNQPPAIQFWSTQATTRTSGAAADGNNPSALGSTAFHRGMQTSASTAWPDRASGCEITPTSDARSGKLDRQSSLFGGLSDGRRRCVTTALRLLKTDVPPISSRPRVGGFSAQLREKQFGLTNGSSFSSLFPKTTFSSNQDRAKAKQNKRHP